MGHFHAIAGSASVVQGEGVSWVQAETIAKMMEKVTGYADRGGSDGIRVDEERGHSAVVWVLRLGMPRPLMRRVLSCCVPAGILMTVLPFSVGTSIFPPSMAVTR